MSDSALATPTPEGAATTLDPVLQRQLDRLALLDAKTAYVPVEEVWIISIAGYGLFAFRGSEEDAQAMCAAKANWEGGQGRVWRATDALEDRSLRRGTILALLSAVSSPRDITDRSNLG